MVIIQHILPNRVLTEPLEHFETPVDDNTAYVNRLNHGTLWSMLFRKIFGAGRERSINQILPEESEKLKRLLVKLNDGQLSTFERKPYYLKNKLPIIPNWGGKVPVETSLQVWIMENVDKNIPVCWRKCAVSLKTGTIHLKGALGL